MSVQQQALKQSPEHIMPTSGENMFLSKTVFALQAGIRSLVPTDSKTHPQPKGSSKEQSALHPEIYIWSPNT